MTTHESSPLERTEEIVNRSNQIERLTTSIDHLVLILAERDKALLSEVGHLRQEFRNVATNISNLSDAVKPLKEDHDRQAAVAQARADLHIQGEQRLQSLVDLSKHPVVKGVFYAIAAALAAALSLNSCGASVIPETISSTNEIVFLR